VLAAAWPEHDFGTLEEVWWPDRTETTESTLARAASFRAEMERDPDWRHTLVVSHWAFLLTFSGTSLENGTWMRLGHLAAP
jgi:broad specificity phosphatase PhoE